METTENKTTELEKAQSVAAKKFEMTVAEANEIANTCKSIKIQDKTMLAMAEQVLSRASKMLKQADEKRKEILKPHADYTKMVNELVKSKITMPLEEAIAYGKDQLRKWNEEEAKRAAQELAEANKKFAFLKGLEEQLNTKVREANTPKACTDLIMSIEQKWPKDEAFGQYVEEATKTKNNFITFLKTKMLAIEATLQGGEDAVAVVAKMTEQQSQAESNQEAVSAAIIEKKEIAVDTISSSKSKTRKVYKFEVVDEDKLGRQFLSVDDSKVRLHMNAIKESVTKEGIVIDGVRFYIDEVPIVS